MTLYEQMQALVASSAGGVDLATPLVADPLGMQPPPLFEVEAATVMAARLDDLLASADDDELRAARRDAEGDPILRDSIDTEIDRRGLGAA
jgi:hypothetical protein